MNYFYISCSFNNPEPHCECKSMLESLSLFLSESELLSNILQYFKNKSFLCLSIFLGLNDF